jgi:hypothetical protein
MKSVRLKQSHERAHKGPPGDAGFVRPFSESRGNGGRFRSPKTDHFPFILHPKRYSGHPFSDSLRNQGCRQH